MRRPVKDEHFADPDGNVWQVLEVGKWRTSTRPPTEEEITKGKPKQPIPCGPFNVAYFVMVNTDGERKKVSSVEINDWAPATDKNGKQIGDPLEGNRNAVVKAVKAGRGMFHLDGEAFVLKGDRYHLPCGEILVNKVEVKTNKREKRIRRFISRI